MPTILILFGLRFMIYTRDHYPPHIQVLKEVVGAKIGIYPEIYIMENRGLSDKDLKIALEVCEKNQELLLEKWVEFHGEIE